MYKFIFSLIVCIYISVKAQEHENKTSWAEETLEKLSLQEKIGQLFVVAATKDNQSEIAEFIHRYHIGGILLAGRNTVEKQIDTVNSYQEKSKLPLLVAQDCEWGLSMRLDDTIRFPRNLTLGALKDSALLYEMGKEIGLQCKAVGVHFNLAPVIDINNNPKNSVINDRSFGEKKEKVAERGTLYMQGLQDAGIIACAKHFPGHGDTEVDSHQGLPCITHTKERFEELELYPFKELIRQGVKAIMNAHLKVTVWDTVPSSLSKKLVTDLLRHQLGFGGLVITDALNMKAITENYSQGQAELQALLAGNDCILFPMHIPDAFTLIEQAIKDNTLSIVELDAKVLKILKIKEELNLGVNRYVDKEKAKAFLSSVDAHNLKRKLYQLAITLVKNEQLLPLEEGKRKNLCALLIEGSSQSPLYILLNAQGISTSVVKAQELENSVINKDIILIALFGMNKYANQEYGILPQVRIFIENLVREGKKVILALFGSPYSLEFFGKESAILIAYEDDHDTHQAVVDIIFGTLNPQGTLPVTASAQFKEGTGLYYS